MQDVEFGDSEPHGGKEKNRGEAAHDNQGVAPQSPTAERLDKELVKLRLVLQEHMGRRTVS